MKTLRRIGYRLSRTPLRAPVMWLRHRGVSQDDVFLASYPRSGNTWLRFLLADILTGQKIDFDNINRFIPELGLQGSAERLIHNGILVKTHEPYRREYKKAIYVVRDIRHVALSNYARGVELGLLTNLNFDTFLCSFLQGCASRVGSWQDHVTSWLDSPLKASDNLLLVKYEDLRRDTGREIGRILAFLGIQIEAEKVQHAIAQNTVSKMRSKEDASKSLPASSSEVGRFVRTGSVAGWQERFSQAQIDSVARSAAEALSRLGYPVTFTRAQELKPCVG